MYAGPSKRVARKAICPSCHFLAAYRPLSNSSMLAAKRERTPSYVKKVRPNAPGSLSNVVGAAETDLARLNAKPHYISPDFATGLQQLGFYSIPAVVDVLRELSQYAAKFPPANAFSAISTQQRFIQIMEAALGSTEVALMRDPKALRKALHLLGQNYFHERNRFAIAGFETLRVVFLAGELDAGIDTAAAEMLYNLAQAKKDRKFAPGSLHSPRIFEFIRAKALARSDWRATTLYLKEMSQLPQTEATARDCYQLAKEFYETVEPSKKLRIENPWLLQWYELPWKIFYEASLAYLAYLPKGDEHDKVQADIDKALHDGLYKYTDPDAVAPALRDAKFLTRHSKVWLEFATQSATGGDKEAALDLAMYHLSKDGWRPKVPGKKPTKWTGLEWLAVSAALSAPDTHRMVYLYAGLAHLLREHGYLAEGKSWLKCAKENVGEAGLDVKGGEWETLISDYEKAWNIAENGDEIMEGYVKPSDYYFEYYISELDMATPL